MGTSFGEFRQTPKGRGFSPTYFTLCLRVILMGGGFVKAWMAVVSVPKDLDRVKKSLVWFWKVHGLSCGLCDVMLLPWVNNMLIVVLWAVPR